jgi:hypothetical protein
MLRERKELLNSICTVFKYLDDSSSPTGPAVIAAKRTILNGLAELHLVDALDDASSIAALTALPLAPSDAPRRNP